MADTTNLPNPTETPSLSNSSTSTNSPGTIAIRQTPNQGSRGLSLRNWSLILITASIAAALSPLSNIITSLLYAQPPLEPTDYLGRAKSVLETTPLIDGHNDLPYMLRIELQNKIYGTVDLQKKLLGHTDFARMREGQVGGQFWSVFVDCEDVGYVNDPTAAVRDTLEQIDVTKRMIDNYTSILEYCDNPRCARDAFKKGKIASMLGIEGGHQVGNSLGSIRQFYDLGVRYITTTHNCDNAFATSASTVAKGGPDHGLSTFGHEYVKEMNRLGMMIDLSHVSHQTMRDVLSVTRAPVIFSHSGAYAVTKHMRHVPDDVLRSVRKNGGIVMMTFINRFLNMEDPDSASIDDVLDHIFHMAQTAGWENIGIGGDYSGTPECPKGLEDVSKYPYLIAGLLERGATDEQVRGVAGENILRVWAAVNDVAVQIQKETLPNEAVWDGRVWTKGHSWLPFMFSGSRMRLHGAVKAPKPTAGDWNIKI